MKTILKKTMLLPVLLLSLAIGSCDVDDNYLQEDIVGAWSYFYEDETLFEEAVYDFDPTGCWVYRYIYDDAITGEYIYEVDAGTYYISYGQLNLKSNFSDDEYSYGVSIYGDRMVLRDGDYYGEYQRYR